MGGAYSESSHAYLSYELERFYQRSSKAARGIVTLSRANSKRFHGLRNKEPDRSEQQRNSDESPRCGYHRKIVGMRGEEYVNRCYKQQRIHWSSGPCCQHRD